MNDLKINWFPGHMKKTLESLKEMTKKVDKWREEESKKITKKRRPDLL